MSKLSKIEIFPLKGENTEAKIISAHDLSEKLFDKFKVNSILKKDADYSVKKYLKGCIENSLESEVEDIFFLSEKTALEAIKKAKNTARVLTTISY